jgi:hypothetical protein
MRAEKGRRIDRISKAEKVVPRRSGNRIKLASDGVDTIIRQNRMLGR